MIKLHEILLPKTQPCKITVYESSEALEIRLKLVMAVDGNTDTIARGIDSMLRSDTPINKIILEIKQMAQTDYSFMSNLIGAALLDTIVNFK